MNKKAFGLILLLSLCSLFELSANEKFENKKIINLIDHGLWMIPPLFFSDIYTKEASVFTPLKFALAYTLCSAFFYPDTIDTRLQKEQEKKDFTFFNSPKSDYLTILNTKTGESIIIKKRYLHAFCKMFATQLAIQTSKSPLVAYFVGLTTSLTCDLYL